MLLEPVPGALRRGRVRKPLSERNAAIVAQREALPKFLAGSPRDPATYPKALPPVPLFHSAAAAQLAAELANPHSELSAAIRAGRAAKGKRHG